MLHKKRIARLVAAGARSATFRSMLGDGASLDELILYINLTALTGTNVLPTVEGSPDGGTTWFPIVALTSRTATGLYTELVKGPIPALFSINFTGTFSSANMIVDAEYVTTGATVS